MYLAQNQTSEPIYLCFVLGKVLFKAVSSLKDGVLFSLFTKLFRFACRFNPLG